MRQLLLLLLVVCLAFLASAQSVATGIVRAGYQGPDPLEVILDTSLPFKVEFSRECTDTDFLLSERLLTVSFVVPEGLTMQGTTEVAFPQQICAQQPSVARTGAYNLTALSNATLGPRNVTIDWQLAPFAGQAPQQGDPLVLAVDVRSMPSRPLGNETTTFEAPVPGPELALLLGFVLVAAVLRRRRA